MMYNEIIHPLPFPFFFSDEKYVFVLLFLCLDLKIISEFRPFQTKQKKNQIPNEEINWKCKEKNILMKL